MTAQPEVGTAPRGMSVTSLLDARREKVSMAIANADAGHDLALLDDEHFAKKLELDRRRQARIQEVIDNRLVDKVHYGTVPGVRKPFLWAPGAEVFRDLYRYTAQVMERSTTETEDYVSASVTVGIFGPSGLLLCTRAGNCNTREKRFQAKGGDEKGERWIYKDAREQVHNCLAMAEKRASVLATREACGASGHFAYPEEMEKELGREGTTSDEAPLTSTEVKALRWDAFTLLGIKPGEPWAALWREAITAEVFDGREDFTKAHGAAVAALIDDKRRAKEASKQSVGSAAKSEQRTLEDNIEPTR